MANHHHATLARQFMQLQLEYIDSRIKLATLSYELAGALGQETPMGTHAITFTYPPHHINALEDAYMELLTRLTNSQASVRHMRDKLDVALGRVLLPDDGTELDMRIAEATTMTC